MRHCNFEFLEGLPCFVYFFGITPDGMIKIGYTSRPKVRLQQLRTRRTKDVGFLAVAPGMPWDEAGLHRRFRAHCAEGEWFYAVPEIIDVVTRTQQSGQLPRDACFEMPLYLQRITLRLNSSDIDAAERLAPNEAAA